MGKTLIFPYTRAELQILHDPEMNKLFGIMADISRVQDIHPPVWELIPEFPYEDVPLKVIQFLRAAPYNYDVFETGTGQLRTITKINWAP